MSDAATTLMNYVNQMNDESLEQNEKDFCERMCRIWASEIIAAIW